MADAYFITDEQFQCDESVSENGRVWYQGQSPAPKIECSTGRVPISERLILHCSFLINIIIERRIAQNQSGNLRSLTYKKTRKVNSLKRYVKISPYYVLSRAETYDAFIRNIYFMLEFCERSHIPPSILSDSIILILLLNDKTVDYLLISASV